jgi:GlpG protein
LFWVWLVGCIIATRLGVAEIGNAAHVGGLAFGILVAHWLLLSTHRKLAVNGTALFLAASMTPLFWMPWSPRWVGHQAYKAHVAGEYDAAIAGYRLSMELGEDRVWALGNLAEAYYQKGAEKEYTATLDELQGLAPDAANEVMERLGDQREEAER